MIGISATAVRDLFITHFPVVITSVRGASRTYWNDTIGGCSLVSPYRFHGPSFPVKIEGAVVDDGIIKTGISSLIGISRVVTGSGVIKIGRASCRERVCQYV